MTATAAVEAALGQLLPLYQREMDGWRLRRRGVACAWAYSSEPKRLERGAGVLLYREKGGRRRGEECSVKLLTKAAAGLGGMARGSNPNRTSQN